jgi:predicted GNAT family N-acyltransferase
MNYIPEVKKITDTEDLKKAFSIRRTVFVEEQNCPPELEWENDGFATHFLATYNGTPAGAARWRKTENGYKLERFAVLKEFRGKKIGEALVASVLKDIPPEAGMVYLNSQIQAVGFYLKLGFETYGEQFEEAGILHYKMIRTLS